MNLVLKDLAKEEMLAVNKENGHCFIQWHGMAQTSCPSSDVFISAGIGNSPIYDQYIPSINIVHNFNKIAKRLKMNASTPRIDQTCKLAATTNIFGRYINGVPERDACSKPAKESDVTGRFVHIEQKEGSRDNHPLWIHVIRDAFPLVLI
uniref:GMC_oxred_C domain-containing protein n=1 Tax=Heterorhabditis bacteriophora TaxID=37862 RepID=A0A1I7XHE2_HETBA